jgi:general secretion pathway protein C
MELLFKKYFWLLNAALLVLLAFLVARLLASWTRYELLALAQTDATAETLTVDSSDNSFRAGQFGSKVDTSRRRELMEKAPELPPTPAEVAPPKEDFFEEPEEAAEPTGSLKLEYHAAVISSNPKNSLAFVKVDDAEEGRWVGMGEALKGEIRVEEITRRLIRASDGTVKYMWQGKEEEEPKEAGLRKPSIPGRPLGPTAEPAAAENAGDDAVVQGITKVGPFEYHIDRALIDEQLQDLTKLGRQARVIPNYDRESGGYKGFKLIGVRPNSLYRGIGIRSGDVIMQVNGDELNSPSKALELFTKLQTSNQISLDIKRRGKNETLVYKIQ